MASLQRYTDRRVLITGAGSGIGQACALRILDEGGRVAGRRYQRTRPGGHRNQGGRHRRPTHDGRY